jgi:hypothetical protein
MGGLVVALLVVLGCRVMSLGSVLMGFGSHFMIGIGHVYVSSVFFDEDVRICTPHPAGQRRAVRALQATSHPQHKSDGGACGLKSPPCAPAPAEL